MRFEKIPIRGFSSSAKRRTSRVSGFTFAEVLAALVFLALVIPVALEGLRIGNRASVVAERKTDAALLADRLLNEIVVTRSWSSGLPGGTYEQEGKFYQWTARTDPWRFDALRVVTVEVVFVVQERDYSVQVSTLVDESDTL